MVLGAGQIGKTTNQTKYLTGLLQIEINVNLFTSD
jgi:hypothetical protein